MSIHVGFLFCENSYPTRGLCVAKPGGCLIIGPHQLQNTHDHNHNPTPNPNPNCNPDPNHNAHTHECTTLTVGILFTTKPNTFYWCRRITPRRATSGALGKQCLQKVESPKKQQRQHFTVPLNRRMPKRIGGGPIRHTAYLHISLDSLRFLFTLQLSFALRSPLSRGLASRGNTAIRRHAARKTGSIYS